MKLKLDLHPIYSDSHKIEQGLVNIIAEAVDKRASEVEIIPGKGSGALKKTVLRFLERPEIKNLYHRVEKDDENFGRIFVHFRFTPEKQTKAGGKVRLEFTGKCFCCDGEIRQEFDEAPVANERFTAITECPSCGSPNRMTVAASRTGKVIVLVESGYEAE